MCQVKTNLFASFIDRVHEYRFHAYSWTIIVQSPFYFILSQLFIAFYDKFSLMIQVLIKFFRLIKIKIKYFVVSYYNRIFLHYYNDLIKLLQTFLVVLICWYKKHIICMNCFHVLWELIILETWLIVCLELQFLILFFLLSPYYLPLLTWLESHENLYHIYLVFFITLSCCISQFFILKPHIIITFFEK